MTTVRELIEYLQTLPESAEVQVVEGYDCGYSYCTKEVDINLHPYDGNVDFIDLTGNQFVDQDDERFNNAYLILGLK